MPKSSPSSPLEPCTESKRTVLVLEERDSSSSSASSPEPSRLSNQPARSKKRGKGPAQLTSIKGFDPGDGEVVELLLVDLAHVADLLDGALAHQAVDLHVPLLPEPEGPVLRLDGRTDGQEEPSRCQGD